MPCYTPLKGYRALNGGFTSDYKGSLGLPLTVPCGQCIGCRLEYARRWAIRCMHEAQLHDHSYFLTLTYSDVHLPPNLSLDKSHLTKFFKRFRKNTQSKIRYYACGEYGDTTHRPHYHALLYGHVFSDRILHNNAGGHSLYTSPTLDKSWGLGHALIGDLTFESASYVARYSTKKLTGELGKQAYGERGLVPPYVVMSRRPGIGQAWYDRFSSDVYPSDEVVCRGNYTSRPPRYYDNILEKTNPELFKSIKDKRLQLAQELKLDEKSGMERYAGHEIARSRLSTYNKNQI